VSEAAWAARFRHANVQFTNPVTRDVNAQHLLRADGATGGVGTNGISANNLPNGAFGANQRCRG
jgi:hypothetical protein